MKAPTLRVAIDVGSESHWVGVGLSEGELLEAFKIPHSQVGFEEFFTRVERHRRRVKRPVEVAMEGYNGWARPLDGQIEQRGYQLFNVNNLKLARFKEIFPAPIKQDPVDTDKMLELFQLGDTLKRAKNVLQEVKPVSEANRKLKRLTRRRRQLVDEKVSVGNRLRGDLQAVCPELLSLTGSIDNRWFLRFLTATSELVKLSRLRRSTLLKLRGVGRAYADLIQGWQKGARFSPDVQWVGEMIQSDARRMQQLLEQIDALEQAIQGVSAESELAQRIDSIPGFGVISSGELAGEIGTVERFAKEASLALYVGMATLDRSSGETEGSRRTRHVNHRARQALMRALARHIEQVPQSRTYYDKKRSEGKEHNAAIRCLGRHLVRVLWKMLTENRDYEIRR